MKRLQDTFVFTREFGVRLLDLRLKAGLTQSVLPAIRTDVFGVVVPIGPQSGGRTAENMIQSHGALASDSARYSPRFPIGSVREAGGVPLPDPPAVVLCSPGG